MGYRKSYWPGLCRETRDLMKERDRRREQNDNDPSLIDLQARIDKLIHDSAQDRWHDELWQSDHKSDVRHFWNKIKTLKGESSTTLPN